MNRYLYRVAYAYADGMTPIVGVITTAYEPVCVRATTEAAALDEVTGLTRYMTAAGVTRTITLVTTTADV